MCHSSAPANALYWAMISIFLTWTLEFSCLSSHILPVLSVTLFLFHLISSSLLSQTLCTSPSGYPLLSVYGHLCMCVFFTETSSSLDAQALSPLSDFPSLSSVYVCLPGSWLRMPLPHVCLPPPLSGPSACVWEECPHMHVGSPAHHGAPQSLLLGGLSPCAERLCLPAREPWAAGVGG